MSYEELTKFYNNCPSIKEAKKLIIKNLNTDLDRYDLCVCKHTKGYHQLKEEECIICSCPKYEDKK